jgi:hypothetical protein
MGKSAIPGQPCIAAGSRPLRRRTGRVDMNRAEGNVIDSREAGWWLPTLSHDSEVACQEVVTALGKAERIGPSPLDRYQAILLVDEWAAPLQKKLLEDYAHSVPSGPGRGAEIAGTLGTIEQSFGQCYDTLSASLRSVPPGHDYPLLSYVTLARRLAHLRYESVLVALGHENLLRWQKIHRLYRSAMQQRTRTAGKFASIGADPEMPDASAEAEYIQILLTCRLAEGALAPQEVLCAVGWLRGWADALAISHEPVTENAFAIFPSGSDGLVAPPRVLSTGLLWLDVAPLHRLIRRKLGNEQHETEPDDSIALSRERRVALLDRLLLLWRGPHGAAIRQEPRRSVYKVVRVAFGLPDIVLTMQRADAEIEAQAERVSESGNGADNGDSTGRWTVNDAGDSGCRLHGDTKAMAAIAVGALVALRVEGIGVWIVGIVRRKGSLAGEESDLGIRILSTHIRLLALDAGRGEPAATTATHADGESAPGSVGPTTSGMAALLVGPGTGPHAAVRQSLLIPTSDYAAGRRYFCETKRHRYRLALGNAIERNAEYVWTSITVTKIAILGGPAGSSRLPPAGDDTITPM